MTQKSGIGTVKIMNSEKNKTIFCSSQKWCYFYGEGRRKHGEAHHLIEVTCGRSDLGLLSQVVMETFVLYADEINLL